MAPADGEGRPVVIDCTPRSELTREDMAILDRWTPLAPDPEAAVCGGPHCQAARRLAGDRGAAATAKRARLRKVARELHTAWLRPHGVRLTETDINLYFTHPAIGGIELALCPQHVLHTDLWDLCAALRDLTAGKGDTG